MTLTGTDLKLACKLAYDIAKNKFLDDDGKKTLGPIEVGGQMLTPIVFTRIGEAHIDICLFLGEQRYSRKSLTIDRDGTMHEDRGIVPAFDLIEDEPDFSTRTNEDIIQVILPKIYEA